MPYVSGDVKCVGSDIGTRNINHEWQLALQKAAKNSFGGK